MPRWFPTIEMLSNGTNTNFNVNGSITPVEFSYQPASTRILAVNEIKFLVSATGNVNQLVSKFMDMPVLLNGIDVEIKISDGINLSTSVVKNNFDVFRFFQTKYSQGLIGSANVLEGSLQIKPPMILDGARGDYYKIRIRDDLTTLQSASVMLIGKLYKP